MLTIGYQYITGSGRRSSGTRNNALSLKIEQDNKNVKGVLLDCSNKHLKHMALLNFKPPEKSLSIAMLPSASRLIALRKTK